MRYGIICRLADFLSISEIPSAQMGGMNALMEAQDSPRALFAKAQAGDRGAFDALVAKYQARLATLARLRLGRDLRGHVEVEDVLQDALLRAFLSLPEASFESEQTFFGWLARILEHVIVDLARRRAARPESRLDREVADSAVSPSRGLRREERFARLERALDDLGPDDREVIILARIQGLSLKEIAGRMRRSHAAVAQLLTRALRKLRACFGNTESLHLPDRHVGRKEEADG
jgi:RNA polymerase sigma-70 factor (ECF subfamily)